MANLLSTKVLSVYTSIDLTWECLYYYTLSNTEISSFSQVCLSIVFFFISLYFNLHFWNNGKVEHFAYLHIIRLYFFCSIEP